MKPALLIAAVLSVQLGDVGVLAFADQARTAFRALCALGGRTW